MNHFVMLVSDINFILIDDKVSANTASSGSRCYKKYDGSQHVEGPQMYQINSQTNSFQNMCDMLKITIDRLARKIDSLQKKKTSKPPILVDTNLGYLTL